MRTLAQAYRRQLSFKKFGAGGYLDDEIDPTETRRPTMNRLDSVSYPQLPQSQASFTGTQQDLSRYQPDIATKEQDELTARRGTNFLSAGIQLGGSAFLGALSSQEKRRDPASNYHPAGYYENKTAMTDAMQGAQIGSKLGPIGTVAGAAIGGVYGYFHGKKLGQQARQEAATRDAAFKKGRELDMQAQQLQNPDFAQGNMNAQMYGNGGHLKKNPAHFTDYTGHQMYGNGGSIPSTQDSLNVMNSSIALQNFYANDKFHGPAERYIYDVKLDANSLKDLKQETSTTYNNMMTKTHYMDYMKTYGLTPMAYSFALKKAIDDTKKDTEYVTHYKDKYSSKIDITAPSALVDSRIPPQGLISYYAKPGYKDGPAGSVSASYYYDPIVVKPAAMKTKQDWAYLNKTYNTPIPNQTSSTSGTSAAVINSKVIPKIKRTNAFDRLQNQPFPNSSASNIQGQQVPIPPMTLPKQTGTPVYGPGGTIVGYSGDGMHFKQAYEYTGAPNSALNLQDKALLNNPDALHEYLSKRDTYKFGNGGTLDLQNKRVSSTDNTYTAPALVPLYKPLTKSEVATSKLASKLNQDTKFNATNTREATLQRQRKHQYPYETSKTEKIRNDAGEKLSQSTSSFAAGLDPTVISSWIDIYNNGVQVPQDMIPRDLASRAGQGLYDIGKAINKSGPKVVGRALKFVPYAGAAADIYDGVNQLQQSDSMFNAADRIDSTENSLQTNLRQFLSKKAFGGSLGNNAYYTGLYNNPYGDSEYRKALMKNFWESRGLKSPMFGNGGSLAQNFLANQKAVGGTMTPMSKDTTIANGPAHEQGGIDLPAQGAQVEGGETTSGDYVFSKVLGFAQLHKPIAMSEGKIQNKPATAERITALQKLGERTKKLKSLQEHFKQALNLQ